MKRLKQRRSKSVHHSELRAVVSVRLPKIPPSNKSFISTTGKFNKLPSIPNSEANETPKLNVDAKSTFHRTNNLLYPRIIRGKARVQKLEQDFFDSAMLQYEDLSKPQQSAMSSILLQHSQALSRTSLKDSSSKEYPVIKNNLYHRPSKEEPRNITERKITVIKPVELTAAQRYSKFVKSLGDQSQDRLDTMDKMGKDLMSLTQNLQTWVDANLNVNIEDDKCTTVTSQIDATIEDAIHDGLSQSINAGEAPPKVSDFEILLNAYKSRMVTTEENNNHAMTESSPPASLVNITPKPSLKWNQKLPSIAPNRPKYGQWYTAPDTWSEIYSTAKRGKIDIESKTKQRMQNFNNILLSRADHFKVLEDAIDNGAQRLSSRASTLNLLA